MRSPRTSRAAPRAAPAPRTGRRTGPIAALPDAGRRAQIVRESARLFRERGYEGTSVRDIAAATGLQSGSWVYHFGTKQEILRAVMEEGLRRALERIEAIAVRRGGPRARFEALVHAHLETLLAPGQDFIPVLLYDWRSLDAGARPAIVALQARYEAVWDRVLGELRRSGEWAAPTAIDRLLLFGALNWIAHWYRPGGPLGIPALARQAVAFFLRQTSRRRSGPERPVRRVPRRPRSR
ncbi:MAG: TetR family transcriptional regulator [Proteobacteria bacterium]|nr:TetR family transcriptional regulator [Pseudomonadota bacterium]